MTKRMPLPSTTDWTWVLGQPCPQCGVDTRSLSIAEIIEQAGAYVEKLAFALEVDPEAGERVEPEVWSMLEYGAHLRDVCAVFRARIKAMLLHEAPTYPDWDQEAAAIEGRYTEHYPADIADELRTVAGDLLRDVAHLSAEEFSRTGVRSDGYVFTVESLLRYYFHELAHHWWDVSGEEYQEHVASLA